MIRHPFYFHAFLFFAAATPVSAEFLCTSDISYQWRPESSKDASAPTTTPAAAPAEAEGRKVFWRRVEARGTTEDEARLKVIEESNKERAKADVACVDSHENQTRCIAGKYSQNSAVLSMMSFSQRTELEKSIVQDCKNNMGRCLGAAGTEIGCRPLVPADGSEGAGDEKKGDDKKKDGKKK